MNLKELAIEVLNGKQITREVKMVNYDTQRNGKTQCFTVPFCFSNLFLQNHNMDISL